MKEERLLVFACCLLLKDTLGEAPQRLAFDDEFQHSPASCRGSPRRLARENVPSFAPLLHALRGIDKSRLPCAPATLSRPTIIVRVLSAFRLCNPGIGRDGGSNDAATAAVTFAVFAPGPTLLQGATQAPQSMCKSIPQERP